jgi:hypothetical protein
MVKRKMANRNYKLLFKYLRMFDGKVKRIYNFQWRVDTYLTHSTKLNGEILQIWTKLKSGKHGWRNANTKEKAIIEALQHFVDVV